MIYETREQGCNAFIEEARPIFETLGYPIPPRVRVSIGYAPNSRVTKDNRKLAAVIVAPSASADNHYEIFLSPANVTPVELFAALTHELVHCAIGMKEKHGEKFVRLSKATGLVAPFTAAKPGEGWFNWASDIVSSIEMPYASIDIKQGDLNKPTKETYALKIECPSCKWHARASEKQATAAPYLNCPIPDCGDVLIIHPRKVSPN